MERPPPVGVGRLEENPPPSATDEVALGDTPEASIERRAASSRLTRRGMRMRRRRRRRRLVLSIVGGLFLLWVIGAAYSAYVGVREARAARSEIQTARDSLDPATADFDELAGQLASATARLDRAGRALGSPFLLPFRGVPFVSSQLDSASSLVEGGEAAGRSLLMAVEALNGALDELDAGADVPTVMNRLDAVFEKAQGELLEVNLGPSSGLLATLAQNRDLLAAEINVALDSLEDGRRLARGAGGFFTDGRYLVLAANPSEMRLGMGMILQVGILTTAADGSLSLDRFRSVSLVTPEPGTVRIVDEDLARNWSWLHPEWLWQNIALTPRFPVVARQAAAYWHQIDRTPIDGVISIDSRAVADLVGVVGPLQVDGVTFDRASMRDHLANGQYQSVEGSHQERRDQLGVVAAALFAKVTQRGLQDQEILDAVVAAVRGRRIMLWSPDVDQQAAWTIMGADGEPVEDSLMISLSNHSSNKLDWFMGTEADLTVREVGGARQVVVDLGVVNSAPSGEPEYVTGTVASPPGTYVGIISLSVPGDAIGLSITGVGSEAPPIIGARFELLSSGNSSQPVVAGPDGANRIISMVVRVPRNDRAEIQVTFGLGPGSNTLEILPTPSWHGIEWADGWPADRSVSIRLDELTAP